MKTTPTFLFAILIATSLTAACDKENKSGPIADEPQAEPAEPTTTKPAAVAKGGLYSTSGPDAAVKAGEAADVTLSVKPSEGFKINKEFRWNFEFQPTDGITYGQAKVANDALTLEDSGAAIPLNVTVESAGEHTVTAIGDFSVCNDDKCELYRDQEVSFTISATDG